MALQATTNYRRPFSAWDEESWIRSKPVRRTGFDGHAFPPRLVPLASHPRLAGQPELCRRLLALRLLSHLQFTTLLELEHVNVVCSKLARGKCDVSLTLEQRNDALRIYCDEGGHALFVELLSSEVERQYGVSRAVLTRPRFDAVLEQMLSQFGAAVPLDLLHLMFVSVSETLVTKILREIPGDRETAPIVREVIGDHARDEGTHSVFFHWLFPRVWRASTPAQQQILGAILPEFLWAFLGPDLENERRVLCSLGVPDEEARGLLDEVYAPHIVAKNVRLAAQPTLRMFASAGVLSSATIAEAFAARELYEEGSS